MRIDAIENLSDEQADELFVLVTHARHPIQVRRAAVDRMLSVDAARFWLRAERLAVQIDDWPMIRLLCASAEATHARRALPWLVRSLSVVSRTVPDHERPELRAIQSITGQHPRLTAEQIVFEPGADTHPATRLSAWCVLARMVSANDLRRLAAEADQHDVMLRAMRRALPALDRVPHQPESVYRLLTLDGATSEEQWRRWADWRERHGSKATVRNTELRHLPAIAHVPGDWLEQDRMQWLATLQGRLEARRRVTRAEGKGAFEARFGTPRSEDLAFVRTRLGCADVLALAIMMKALEDRKLIDSLFAQADADLADTTSEHGGVLAWDTDGRVIARRFEPLMRRHDRAYFASDACVRAMHTGLAHYHFHAQQHDNAEWAGPGLGDLEFADRLRANCVVFTFLDRDTLNADAYFPGGVIVDLGSISR